MTRQLPYDVGGYVLAGGHSSRMGQDKALLMLAGKPLIAHAVIKLSRLCKHTSILSANGELACFAPVVADLHKDCGPMGGIEAALVHSACDWNLILPVDVPLLPTALLEVWVRATVGHGEQYGTRVAMYVVDGVPQPALLMIHREMAPYLTDCLMRGEYKLGPALHAAAQDIASNRGILVEQALRRWVWGVESSLEISASVPPGPSWAIPTASQQRGKALWFANLNTPEDFVHAEQHTDVLDT